MPPSPTRRRGDLLNAAALVVMAACCAAPAVLGAAAGSLVGDWLGVAVACVLAIGGLLVLPRRRKGC
jgi:hypothetical protein